MIQLAIAALLSAALLGCHTFGAVRSLGHPSPINTLALQAAEQPASKLDWTASYGFSSYPDNWVLGLFSRTVSHSGSWAFSAPRTICIRTDSAPSILGVGIDAIAFATPDSFMEEPTGGSLEAARVLGCTHFLYAASKTGEDLLSYASGVVLVPIESGAPEALDAPDERPLRDPKRWGWLVVAPVLDVPTIVVAIPFLATIGVLDLYDSLTR
jgi:hypothetical protein